MLYGILITLFVIICMLLVLIVMAQQGKSSMGLGNIGGATQMIFGGSGGQDIFSKNNMGIRIAFYGWIIGAFTDENIILCWLIVQITSSN